MYNYRLCRARRHVECAFGIFSNKRRIFQRPLNVSPDFAAVDIVKTCVVLHNFVRERDGYKIEDAMTVTGLEVVPDGTIGTGGGGVNSEKCKE